MLQKQVRANDELLAVVWLHVKCQLIIGMAILNGNDIYS